MFRLLFIINIIIIYLFIIIIIIIINHNKKLINYVILYFLALHIPNPNPGLLARGYQSNYRMSLNFLCVLSVYVRASPWFRVELPTAFLRTVLESNVLEVSYSLSLQLFFFVVFNTSFVEPSLVVLWSRGARFSCCQLKKNALHFMHSFTFFCLSLLGSQTATTSSRICKYLVKTNECNLNYYFFSSI